MSRDRPGGPAKSRWDGGLRTCGSRLADRGLSHYSHGVGPRRHCCRSRCRHVTDDPTFFGGVPWHLGEAEAALEGGLRRSPMRRSALGHSRRSNSACARCAPNRPVSRSPRSFGCYVRAEELVFSKIRERLGLDRCKWYMIGAAPCPLEVLELFAAIGIPICRGLGPCPSPRRSSSRLDLRLRSSALRIPGVEVRSTRSGEVLVRGDTVMAGYRNQQKPPKRSTLSASCAPATSGSCRMTRASSESPTARRN